MGSPNLVFVTGMHRSGTSVVARAVQALGYNLGGNLMPATHDNPMGYFEDLRFVELNERIMSANNVDWRSANGVITDAPAGTFDGIKNFLIDALEWGGPIALKDPRLCITYPVWRTAADELGWDTRGNVHLIVGIRNPIEVAKSLIRRDGMNMEQALHLWEVYSESVRGAWPLIQTVVVKYERVLDNPLIELGRVANALEVERDMPQAVEFMNFVKQDLRRNREVFDPELLTHNQIDIEMELVSKAMR